jgi:hypothetical protein
LERANERYREQLENAYAQIRFLENALLETPSSAPGVIRDSTIVERLRILRGAAQELENIIRETDSR